MPRIQTASHWGVYSVDVDPSGDIAGVHPFKSDRAPSPLINGLPELVRSPLRIDQPYIRAGYLKPGRNPQGRGSDAFVPVSWHEALDMVQHDLVRVRASFGNEAIYGGSYGWASAGRLHHSPSVLKRFLGLFGGYVDKVGNHSFGAALGITPYVLGRADITQLVVPWPQLLAHTRLVVMFGGANEKNMQIDAGGAINHENQDWLRQAVQSGVEFVNISPARDDLQHRLAADWCPIRPNTDMAMMLALAHTLASEALHDQAFLGRCCTGYATFEDYLLGRTDGQPKSAEWAASITGVPAERTRALARKMAGTRTLVTTAWAVQRADHGEQPVWMTMVLAAMLGQIGLPGGGFSLGFGATNGSTSEKLSGIPRPTFPLGPNPISARVPVGRVADMLLAPGSKLAYNGSMLTMPDIRLVYSVGGNPFHHNGDLNRFIEAWKKPETVIVHEPWWTPAARYADIVLPATTTLERNDILATELQRAYVAMHQVIAPVGQARNDFDIFGELAQRLGFGQAYSEGRDEMQWLRHMYEGAATQARTRGHALPGFDAFWAQGYLEFPLPDTPAAPLLSAFRDDPEGHPLKTPSGRIEIFSERVASFLYADCPGHPTWLEPAEWLGSPLAARFPFHLVSNQPVARLHSQLDPAIASRQSKVAQREPLQLGAEDACAYGIADGDVVKVFNDRGAFLAGAVIVDGLHRGVLRIATGAWMDPGIDAAGLAIDKHGNPNVVTLATGTSCLSQGAVAQTVLVGIEKYAGNAPAVTAFDLPEFAR